MKILITGRGRMGQLIGQMAEEAGHEIMAYIDIDNSDLLDTFPAADVVIDFSHPSFFAKLAAYIERTGSPLCSGTTGYAGEGLAGFKKLSEHAPVLYSANYSIGVNVCKRILSTLPSFMTEDFDVEMVEKHHNKKVDAPSGTAILLADALDPEHKLKRVYGREGQCGARTKDEMGIMALRGGTVAGEHTIYFFGEDETITITHTASSRRIFAAGALKAALILAGQKPGWYTLEEILFAQEA